MAAPRFAPSTRASAASGVTKLELHVFPHNEPAIALYEQHGYEREGYRRHHYRRPDGSVADVVLMAKRLETASAVER